MSDIYLQTAIFFVAGIICAGKTELFNLFLIAVSFIISNISASLIFRNKKGRLNILFLIFLFGAIISAHAQNIQTSKLYPVDDKFIEVSGYVYDLPDEKDGRYRYVIHTDGAKYKNKIYKTNENILFSSDTKYEYAQNISIRGFLKPLNHKMNRHDFDYNMYYKSKGIFYRISDFESATDQSFRKLYSPVHFSKLIKKNISEIIDTYTKGDIAAILKAVLSSDKKDFSEEYEDILVRTNTLRLLYPAYLHIFLIMMILNFFLSASDKKYRNYAAIIILSAYALFNSQSAAVLRLCLTLIVTIYATQKYGYRHFPDIISFVVTAVLLANPLLIYNCGFIISVIVSCVFFAMHDTMYSLLKPIHNKKLRKFISFSVLATIASLPLSAYFFNNFSFYAPLLNLLFFPLVTIILCAFPVVVLELLLFKKVFLIRYILLFATYCIHKLPYFIDKLPLSHINFARPSIFTIILFYCFLVLIKFIHSYGFKNIKTKLMGVLCTTGLSAIIIVNILSIGSMYITFVNVGQGDGAIIELPKGERILVDGGGGPEYSDFNAGEKLFLPYLKNEGIFRVDLAIITHLHKDHYQGIISAIENLNVQTVAIPDFYPDMPIRKEIERTAREHNTNILYLEKGDKITFPSGAVMNIIAPDRSYKEDINDTSIVFNLSCNNFDALFTGDSTKETEEKILDDYKKADLLKVPHHGSKTSSTQEFIDRVDPLYSIVSVGLDNTYSLPDDDTMKRYENSDTILLKTSTNGDIRFKITKGGNVSYDTYHE